MSDAPMLFSPLELRGVTLPNRVVVSPLCMYSATDGVAGDWHFAHLSTFARGGAGLVFTEAAAIERRGRITHGCLGIWSDAHAEALGPIVRFIEDMGSVPGIQIAHAGRKGSTRRPWEGNPPLEADDAARGEGPWPLVAPSAMPVADGWPTPRTLSTAEIAELVDGFAAAARRAAGIGFRVLEIHAAHGYLLHSFLSPIGNRRNDAYGGDLEGRMRFALEVAEAVRAAWPDELPLFCRISAVDGPPEGWTLDDSVILARALKDRGVDVVDCSGGGIGGPPHFRATDDGRALTGRGDRAPGFQVPYAARVRREADIKTMAVGVIVEARQAEEILATGRADLVALGREIMYNPFWPLHAAQALGVDADYDLWPDQYRWAVVRRGQLVAARGDGEAR